VLSGANASANAGERVNLNKDGSATGNGYNAGGGRTIEAHFKALRRSRADRWLGGVCGGLAGTYGIESWVWRLIFTVFTLITSGFGALVYLLMWIFVPEE
jgi:phage shock protein PspC (stress-responsive transcriptional regulator)